ncbi:sugar phosphate isomerase/epimerase family protein [Polaribacter dokdonensis]|uniref:Endonuclease IV n=1 Tax=Polaribacter dokdonensis DSW-5 TaxID=1300348 RepID=A0A0M9CDQ2_9FLAO|nr:sugar phosphate isomerase/epimerase [Polaribacter dokdonensis]KOY50561.1 Endonuclease IV [Polaribacter dokdonensis DSW-5]SEE60781.1 Sugar phosphate isomerase/epimerase [Polaribacter dokdonensis DSW-5]
MTTIKGPAVFLAQFMGDKEPFNTLEGLCKWASNLGYKGIQIPTLDKSIIDLDIAAESQTYCDEFKGKINSFGLEITELSTHIQGQLVAVHSAHDLMFDVFAPKELHGKPKERTLWAVDQMKKAGIVSRRLGLNNHATFSGSLLWPVMHPWPQQPKGLVETGFKELANRWLPILDTFKENDVNVCYEVHPVEDIHDGDTFERFLAATNNHSAVNILYDPSHFVLQQLDYVKYIDHYHEFIKAFHVKDSEFNPSGKKGMFGGYNDWKDRAGRYRSPGDGQVDFKKVFSKLTEYGCDVWAVLEWECIIKSPEQGAREGVKFIQDHIIEVTDKRFDDFAGSKDDIDQNHINRILGI